MLARVLYVILAVPAILATGPVNIDYHDKSLKTSKGDAIPDFSFAGYHASNKPLPATERAVSGKLSATSGNQAKRIQAALDKIGSMGGGVLLLAAGRYRLSSGLTIPNGTTLRGAGVGKTVLLPKDGTTDVVTMGQKTGNPRTSTSVAITDQYVPIGATDVNVQSASGVAVGQTVWVQRAVTAKWVRANGMNDLVRDGKQQTWLKPGALVNQPRKIASISDHTISLDIPLTDSLDKAYMSPRLVAYEGPLSSSEIGLESLSITLSPTCSGKIITDKSCKGSAVSILPWTVNSYARSVTVTGFNGAINIAPNSSQITLQSITVERDGATDNGAGYAADISMLGSQILIVDSSTKGPADAKSFPIVTQGLTAGPNAVVRHHAQQPAMQIQPHAHWAHGLLIDNSTATTTLIDRATAGSGHGWAINGGVAWNIAGDYQIQSPPTGVNWGIGLRGKAIKQSNGTMKAVGQEVEPASLFEAQLAARGMA